MVGFAASAGFGSAGLNAGLDAGVAGLTGLGSGGALGAVSTGGRVGPPAAGLLWVLSLASASAMSSAVGRCEAEAGGAAASALLGALALDGPAAGCRGAAGLIGLGLDGLLKGASAAGWDEPRSADC
jgi:hypothetical protein